jgi:PRTRC genetic system protein B
MHFDIKSGEQQTQLTKAILLYETRRDDYSSQTAYASLHDVMNTGTKANPNVQIMAGTPITQEALLALMGSLGERYILNTELLPESVLSFSPLHLVWWMPACKKRVFFDNKELGKRSAIVPHPALLFVVVGREWLIFAMKGNNRPTKNTPLFHAPYFNVYDNGNICAGTAEIPDRLSTSAIPTWENAFFESAFTHVNGEIRKVSHPKGEYAFWKEMLDNKYEKFPVKFLVDSNQTLHSVMRSLQNQIGRQ